MGFLFDYQLKSIAKMKNGCILCGGVGSGKSRTAIAYYFFENGGGPEVDIEPMSDLPKDLYIITTARKRDTHEWEGDLNPFLISTDPETNLYYNKVIIDSWNNIKKYGDVTDAFFIFNEQRVVGSGTWFKAFIKISKHNNWILLSATPGDTWSDYIPVFIANGFYKNRTEFINEHVVYKRFCKFPQIDKYINTNKLVRLRDSILVDMDFERKTVAHHDDIWVNYDIEAYKHMSRERWDIWLDAPFENASQCCYALRKLVNSDNSRQVKLLEIIEEHPKAIIFYSYDYELEILHGLYYGKGITVSEWNGHKHQPVPDGDSWVYLVNYTAGAEGWNCIKTDTIIFFSQQYSYKILAQSCGRIDRLNTPYKDLYYYHLKSRAPIDLAISRALKNKKNFNENKFINRKEYENENNAYKRNTLK